MLLYSKNISTRLRYTADLLLSEVLGESVQFTDSITDYLSFPGIKINYSSEKTDGIQIIPSGLLHEKGVRSFVPDVSLYEGKPVLFPQTEGDIPFDIFSAAFYLVSRYEEYLEFTPDIHGRFPSKESIAVKHNFIHLPIVNIWANVLAEICKKRYNLQLNKRPYRFIPTIDVDIAYAYKNRGLYRTLLSGIKQVSLGNFADVKKQYDVLSGKMQDPFDTFSYLKEQFSRKTVTPIYFIQTGDWGKYDKNNPCTNKEFSKLVKTLFADGLVGIHPSYHSYRQADIVDAEKKRMEQMCENKVVRSRQHYLRLKMPDSYRLLESIGITEDYTMGYHEVSGFRAGISIPFRFYDLWEDRISDLKIYPLIVMDRTLIRYQGIPADNSFQAVAPIIENVKRHGGNFICLFHNQVLTDTVEGRPWRKVFEQILDNAI